MDCCPAGAITLEGRVDINEETCTECLLCVAECPSGGLEIDSFNFFSVLSKLRKIPHHTFGEGGAPLVLACNMREDIKAHVTTPCMGFLSEEHLTALAAILQAPLQLNLTGCKSCRNSFIVDALKKRLAAVKAKLSSTEADACGCANKIMLIEDKSHLRYQPVPYDRRGFFGALKKLTMERAADVIDNAADQKQAPSYGDKILPFKRRLLNIVITVLIENNNSSSREGKVLFRGILKNYYHNLLFDDNCDKCFACVGMCPTGALKSSQVSSDEYVEDAPPPKLLFDATLCSGCGLCSDFCSKGSISIKQGFQHS